jgi:hypothetical protein
VAEGLGVDAIRLNRVPVPISIALLGTEFNLVVDRLQASFERFVASNEQLAALLHRLDNVGASYSAYGGWVRDHVASAYRSPTDALDAKDIDLIVEDIDGRELGRLIEPPYRMTIFGGYAFETGNRPFDIWALSDTFLIRQLNLLSKLSTLLQVTDFNINAIVFSPAVGSRPATVMDGGSLSALRDRSIDFQCEILPFPVLQVARLLIYGSKLDFGFSDLVVRFILSVALQPDRRRSIEEGLRKHAPRYAKGALYLLNALVSAA